MKKSTIALAFLAGMIGSAAGSLAAPGFQSDWFIADLQNTFHVRQGGLIPADPRFPTMPRVRYLGTKKYGDDVYAVYLKRLP